MTISVKDAGVIHTSIPSVKDAGSWKPVQNGYVKDAGTWKEWFAATLVALPTTITASELNNNPSDSYAGIRLHSDGTIDLTSSPSSFNWASDGGTWLLNGAASDYECLATITGGTATDNGTFGTWLNLGTTREWSSSITFIGTQTCTFSLQIRLVGTGTTIDTATCTVAVDVESGL